MALLALILFKSLAIPEMACAHITHTMVSHSVGTVRAAALAVHGVAGRVPIAYQGTGRRSLAGELGDDWIGLNGGWDGF